MADWEGQAPPLQGRGGLAFCPQASQTVGFQIRLNKLFWRSGRAQHRLRGQITAANCAFHGGGPACCGPITSEEQAADARLLHWTPTVDAGLRGKCGGGFFDYRGFEEVCFARGGKRVANLFEAEIDDFLARHLEEVVRSADDQLQILAFACGGSCAVRAGVEGRLVEDPLRGGVEEGEERIGHHLAIKPKMHAGDRSVDYFVEIAE